MATRAELAAICASSVFADSPRLRQFLTFVVEAHLRGEGAQLKETVIGVEVYGREHTYNPKAEPIVRTEARRLRAKLHDYYSNQGARDSIVITLPTGGYAPKIEGRANEEVAKPVLVEPEVSRANNIRRSRLVIALGVSALTTAGLVAWLAWSPLSTSKTLTLRQMTDQISEDRVTTAAVSPDGKLLAYGTIDGIFLQVIRSKETHLLRSPDNFWADRIRWYADGDKLAVGGISRGALQPAIWAVSLVGSGPVLLHANARDPEPSLDGTRLAYTNAERSEIWVSGVGGEEAHRVVNGGTEQLSILFWSHDGSHVTFSRAHALGEWDPTSETRTFGFGAERAPEAVRKFQSVEVRTGALGRRVFNLNAHQAAITNEGRVLFMSPDKEDRSKGYQLLEFEANSRTGEPKGEPRTLPLASDWIRDLSLSSDGRVGTVVRLISFPSVYVGDYASSPPAVTNLRRLSLDGSGSFPHSWTPDSRAVIFESDRRGNNDLFRQDVDSRVAENIVATPLEDFHANVTPDGRWVLFLQAALHRMAPASIMRVPLAGGPTDQLAGNGELDEFRCALPGGHGCVARKTLGNSAYVFYAFDPEHGLGRELVRTRWTPNFFGDWALSPLGTEIAIPNHSPDSAKIRVVELNGSGEMEVAVAGMVSISGLNWSADGGGWFVALNSVSGRRLIYVDRRGSGTLLLDGSGYAVQSPNGKRLALNVPSVSSNVWGLNGL